MKFILAILLLICSYNSIGQLGNIKGIILDSPTKEIIPAANIYIKELDIITKADLNGEFSIQKVPYGNYTIEIKAIHYKSIVSTIKLNTESFQKKFKLTPSNKILKTVTVSEESEFGTIRKMRPIEGLILTSGRKTEVIKSDLIPGNKSSNIGRQIYSRIPGLNIWESDGAGIQLGIGGRGLSPTRTSNYNTRQNGYDISADALGYPESYYTPPTEAIDEIQLIRGAASLQFGTQFGGLLNFKLKTGPEDKKLDLVLRHTTGSFGLNSSFVSVGGQVSTLNYYAYYQYKFGNDWRPNSSYNLHSGGVFLYKYLTENSKISLDYTKMTYLTQQAGGLTDYQFNTDPTQSNRNRNWFKVNWNLAALQYDYEFNTRTKINTKFFGLLASRQALGYLGQINRVDPLTERNLISGNFKNFGNETRFLKVYNVKELSWAFLTGFRYYNGYNKSEQGFGSNENDANFKYNNPENLEGSSYEFPSQNISLFAEHIFNLTKKLSITPGIRFEHINTNASGYYRNTVEDLAGNVIFDSTYSDTKSNSRQFIISGIGASYQIKKSIESYANISQNYRSINFTDMQIQNPNFKIDPNLEDEKGYNIDLGIRGGIKHKIHYDISLFCLYYQNRIGTTIETDQRLYNTYQYRTNIAASMTKGIEAVAEIDIWKWFINDSSKIDLTYFINASFVDANYLESDEEAFEHKKVELVPPFNFKTGLTIKLKKFSLSYQYSYTHQHFSDATNSTHQANAVNGIIPSYHIMDLSADYSYKKLKFETGINNLTNRSYFTRRATGYPGPGIIPSSPRNLFFTIQLHL